jgi:putative solute:sodium symporter small subunit
MPMANTSPTLTPEKAAAYWSRTSKLMWTLLALWFVFSFVVHYFAPGLNKVRILGFPLGFYMAAQGSLIAFVIMCFWNAKAQTKIDEEFGVSDE